MRTSHRLVLVCAGNVEGNRRWVDAMQWDGADAFAAAPLTEWRVGGKTAGTARSAQGLTFLEVNAAGHMVPMDQPKAALDMLARLMKNAEFGGALADSANGCSPLAGTDMFARRRQREARADCAAVERHH